MTRSTYVFTSESVSEGHPDKVCDRISDAVLDAFLAEEPEARVACETFATTNRVVIGGEVGLSDKEKLSSYMGRIDEIARACIKDIGYEQDKFHHETVEVTNLLHEQSAHIAQGVDAADNKDEGAGDQGIMFGYATNETEELMPAPIHYSHRLVERQAELRKSGALPWLRPDAKSQLTMRYGADGKPERVEAVVLSTQHDPDIAQEDLREAVRREIIEPTLPTEWLHDDTLFHINPTGNFVIGGPQGDCGLTGRKIIVDTYGGMARHGGGAFSGKDPSKVDRSAAYAGRYVAKNIVAAGLARRCEVQVSYAIGVAEPTSIAVNTFGTATLGDDAIVALIREHFDLRPKGLINMLDLKRPIYRTTAAYGHFGRLGDSFTWERTDKADALRAAAGL